MSIRRSQLLEDLIDQTALILSGDFDLCDKLAMHVGHALADHLAEHWGGQQISFPRDLAYRLHLREQTILDDFEAGHSYAALAHKYDMTERGIRKLVRRAKDRRNQLHFTND